MPGRLFQVLFKVEIVEHEAQITRFVDWLRFVCQIIDQPELATELTATEIWLVEALASPCPALEDAVVLARIFIPTQLCSLPGIVQCFRLRTLYLRTLRRRNKLEFGMKPISYIPKKQPGSLLPRILDKNPLTPLACSLANLIPPHRNPLDRLEYLDFANPPANGRFPENRLKNPRAADGVMTS